jgi:hypothetical protein
VSDKDYKPTQATDENGNDRGVFQSPFLAEMRSELETNWGTTNGQWTYSDAEQQG